MKNAMRRTFVAILFAAAIGAAHADGTGGPDSYSAMLGYLDSSSIGGQAFAGLNGASSTNIAAGALNQQANLQAFAVGAYARATIRAQQLQADDRSNAPRDASASIGGQAYAGGRGIASINQASGNGNAELNAVAATLAQQGIRETTDGSLSIVSASAGGQLSQGQNGSGAGTRSVSVAPTAMKGYEGVLQLNQIAGSGNATSNQLLLSVPSTPH